MTYITPTRPGWFLIWTGLSGLLLAAIFSDGGGEIALVLAAFCVFLVLLLTGAATGISPQTKRTAAAKGRKKGAKMEATGIIRRLDDLGRVVIPKEIRRKLHLKEDDPLELYISDGAVTLRKYRPNSGILETLRELREEIHDAEDLEKQVEIIRKVSELETLLKEEK